MCVCFRAFVAGCVPVGVGGCVRVCEGEGVRSCLYRGWVVCVASSKPYLGGQGGAGPAGCPSLTGGGRGGGKKAAYPCFVRRAGRPCSLPVCLVLLLFAWFCSGRSCWLLRRFSRFSPSAPRRPCHTARAAERSPRERLYDSPQCASREAGQDPKNIEPAHRNPSNRSPPVPSPVRAPSPD